LGEAIDAYNYLLKLTPHEQPEKMEEIQKKIDEIQEKINKISQIDDQTNNNK